MSETKFTKGPWEKDETAPYYISAEDGRNVATVHSGLFSNQESKANADIIASAPDLYEALGWLYSQIGQPEISLFGVKKVIDALAKARGEKTDE